MRALTSRERRTVRLGLAAMVVYLAFFGGLQGWKSFSKKRTDYQQLVRQAQNLRRDIQPYESKVLLVKKLMGDFHLDPTKLVPATVVADASAAIQKAASTAGVQVGPVREETARASAGELATIRLDGVGPVPAVMALLYHLQRLGYPLIVESVQINSPTGRPPGAMGPMAPMGAMPPRGAVPPMGAMGPPGMVKLSLTIVILDFTQWHNEEPPHA